MRAPIRGAEIKRVAIQGERGSNSHVAVEQVFRGQPEPPLLPCAASADVFDRLGDGSADCAVLPIENSLHGAVFEHYDLLLRFPVQIVGETLLRVRHNVIALPGVPFAAVRRVLSHPVALSQCRLWLRAHPGVEAVPAYDTAGSVRLLVESASQDSAAIAPERAAAEYGALVLERGVEDHAENYTRFYLVVPEGVAAPEDCNKASLAFALEHRPGSLLQALAIFRDGGLNLTKIESRPVPGRPWEYVFFVDVRFEAPRALADALEGLRRVCTTVRLLGRYRAAE